jgi:iron complex transport system substrate-binding protein
MIKTSKTCSALRRLGFSGALRLVIFSWLFAIYLLINACNTPAIKEASSATKQTNSGSQPKMLVKHARGFSVDYHADYRVLNLIRNQGPKKDTTKFALVSSSKIIPSGFDKAHIIQVPVKRIIGMSSLQIAMADFLDSPEVLIGLANLKYVNSLPVRRNIEAGKIAEVGEEGTINNEAIISLKPDLILATGTVDGNTTKFQTIINAGVPVILVSEWLENTPLGRAEWVKLLAVLLNKEDLVNKKFGEIEMRYTKLAALAREPAKKPSIIVGMPYKGSWFVPDGTSFLSKFLIDAGASYHWSNQRGTGSMGLSFEAVAPIALQADYWINCGTANSKADIAASDQRYTYFKPYKINTIYNFNKRVNDLGSNDYWESGVVNPHLVLSDLIKIIHPELLPSYQLTYYKQIL